MGPTANRRLEEKMNADARSAPDAAGRGEQYSLAKILGIWALATLPIGVLGWVVFSLLATDSGADPLGAGVARLVLLTLG